MRAGRQIDELNDFNNKLPKKKMFTDYKLILFCVCMCVCNKHNERDKGRNYEIIRSVNVISQRL